MPRNPTVVPPRMGPAALTRILRIDRELRSGQQVTCARLAAELEVDARTVRRDIDFMRDQQRAPIEFDSRANSYRYTDPQYVLPEVRLSEGELLHLLTAERFVRQARGTPLADTLETLYTKIRERMTDQVDVDPLVVRRQISFHATPGRRIDERIWSNVFAALRKCHVVEMTYQGLKDGVPGSRRVEPLHIACVDGDWYLIARNEGTQDVRHFAMSRIGQVRVTEEEFAWEDYDPEALLSNRFGRFIGRPGDCLRVVLEFVPEVAPAVKERSWHPRQELEELRDGRVRLTLPIPRDAVAEIRRFVLGWGSRVKVIQPRELQEVVIAEARAMLKANECD